MRAADALDPDRIRAWLPAQAIGARVLVFDAVSSTNTIAAEYGRNPGNHGLVVLAEQQQAGRGRAGNVWFSTRGQSLLCSILLIDSPVRAELMSLAVAVAVAEAIGTQARIKWPNDILVHGRKIGGILLESASHATHQACVLGVGINCHQDRDAFPPELRDCATSVDLVSGTVVDRILLLRRLLCEVQRWLDVAEQDAEQVVAQWQGRSIQLGHRVDIYYNGRTYGGNCIGVDPAQGLVVQLDRGGVRVFDAAHSSINRKPTLSRRGIP